LDFRSESRIVTINTGLIFPLFASLTILYLSLEWLPNRYEFEAIGIGMFLGPTFGTACARTQVNGFYKFILTTLVMSITWLTAIRLLSAFMHPLFVVFDFLWFLVAFSIAVAIQMPNCSTMDSDGKCQYMQKRLVVRRLVCVAIVFAGCWWAMDQYRLDQIAGRTTQLDSATQFAFFVLAGCTRLTAVLLTLALFLKKCKLYFYFIASLVLILLNSSLVLRCLRSVPSELVFLPNLLESSIFLNCASIATVYVILFLNEQLRPTVYHFGSVHLKTNAPSVNDGPPER